MLELTCIDPVIGERYREFIVENTAVTEEEKVKLLLHGTRCQFCSRNAFERWRDKNFPKKAEIQGIILR